MASPARRAQRVVRRVLDLPAFLLAVFLMYWSVPLGMLLGQIRTLKFTGSRNDAYGWGRGLQQLFGIKLRQVPGPKLYKGGPCIWLCNHRSWADFFVDVLTTQGDSQMLSRMAVALVFPMFMFSVVIIRSVILFKRGAIRNKEAFNSMVDRMMARSPVNGLNVYPEGHRSTRPQPLPLRRGMLHYAYSRQLPVQIVVTDGKEAVISEKHMSAHFGQTLLVGYSNVIRSADYATADEFFEAVLQAWNAEWQRVYAFDWAESQPFEDGGVDYAVFYTPSIKILSVLSQGLSMLAFLATLYYSCRWAAWALRACGEWGWTVGVLSVLWLAASLLNACRTMSPPQNRQPVKADLVAWAGVKSAAAEQPPPVKSAAAAGGLANGRAHSGSLRGSKAVQRSSSNNLAATAIS